MRRDAEIGEDGQGEPPTPAKTTSSSLKVAGGGGRAAAEPVGPRWPPARPVLTGALLLGAYMPRCSGGARPTGGSALAKLAVLRGSPPGQGRAPPRLAGGSGGRRRSRLVLGGGGGGGSAAAAGGRDGSGGRRERERSGCARGGARWQQVSRRPPSPGCHLPPARDRRGCPGGTVGRSAGEGCGDGGWGEPGGGGRTGRVSSRLAATSGLAASPGGRRRGGDGGQAALPPETGPPLLAPGPAPLADTERGKTPSFPSPLSSISRRENPRQNGTGCLCGQCPSLVPVRAGGMRSHSFPPASIFHPFADRIAGHWPAAHRGAQDSRRVPIGHSEGGDTEQSPRRQQHPPAVARASIKASADPAALV